MSQGTIKKIISEKGFGFIEGENGELFFHRSAVEGADFSELREGQEVEQRQAAIACVCQFPMEALADVGGTIPTVLLFISFLDL